MLRPVIRSRNEYNIGKEPGNTSLHLYHKNNHVIYRPDMSSTMVLLEFRNSVEHTAREHVSGL